MATASVLRSYSACPPLSAAGLPLCSSMFCHGGQPVLAISKTLRDRGLVPCPLHKHKGPGSSSASPSETIPSTVSSPLVSLEDAQPRDMSRMAPSANLPSSDFLIQPPSHVGHAALQLEVPPASTSYPTVPRSSRSTGDVVPPLSARTNPSPPGKLSFKRKRGSSDATTSIAESKVEGLPGDRGVSERGTGRSLDNSPQSSKRHKRERDHPKEASMPILAREDDGQHLPGSGLTQGLPAYDEPIAPPSPSTIPSMVAANDIVTFTEEETASLKVLFDLTSNDGLFSGLDFHLFQA